MSELSSKMEHLGSIVSQCGGAVIAFSGGVDSTFLLAVTAELLGERVLAVTISSGLAPGSEIEEAKAAAGDLGVRHRIIEIDEMEIPGMRENPPDRCYHCKKHLFTRIVEAAAEAALPCVMEASNTDDLSDYRPGIRAVRELGVMSPLSGAGLTKEEIRRLSRERGLQTWNKPSAACLASRIPYGEQVTREKLDRVARGEALLHEAGFPSCRLRHHGGTARIEVPAADIGRLLDDGIREGIARGLKELGFTYISIDLEGYRTGSLNETL